MGREKERSGRFRLRFPGERAGWSSPRSSREREKSGKKRGGDASITLEKRKRRCTEKEPAVRGETRRRRRGKRRLGRLGRKRNQKIDRWMDIEGERKSQRRKEREAGWRYSEERGKRGDCFALLGWDEGERKKENER